MALVGEAFLSASVQVLCDKIASGELIDFFRSRKLNHSLLEKLNTTLLTLHAVLNDAEEKQIVNPDVGKWLDKLKHAVFDAEDLLDEIDTEASRSKLEDPTVKTKVWKFFSTSVNPFYQGMNGRIEELFQRLEHLAKYKDVLGLRGGVGGKVSQRNSTSHVVEHEFCTFGRQRDKKKLEKLLLSTDGSNNMSVIPIVGMGGVGKTTLAQLLYNDDKVTKHFDTKAWACVTEDFDAVRVTKALLESLTLKPCDILDMSVLQVQLREQVRGKKFLFVLDDLWNDNYDDWNLLRAPFTFGEGGSKVIVTTRNKSVASIVHTIPIHYLEQLSQEDCWLLLAKHAFRNESLTAHSDLEAIGKKIARKCNGLPLAAKTLGGLLSCNIDYKEWDRILQSNIWELRENSILPSLRLSYHYLPSYLKQCFAYCSIFPKDYEFQKEEVILLWAAEGLIPQTESEKIIEEVGEKYFDELLSRSLLQRSRIRSHFTMHDLINDLTMFVSREFCFRLDDAGSREAPDRVRHFSYMRGTFDTHTRFKPLDEVKCLRTFLPMSLRPYYQLYPDLYVSKKVPDELLRELKCLRVMSLSRYKNFTQLPDCIGDHIHLRYIDLSYTEIKRLPDTVCNLYNLQTLLLLGCSSLIELPADMRKLINLRHLDISGTNIKEMPGQMGSLRSLRTLTAFVVGKSNGSGIRELRQLKHLHGKLSISELQNVVDNLDAVWANLKEKKDLKELELAWGDGVDTDDSQKERDVLDKLQPFINLEKLAIRFYGGTSFPNWLGDSSYSNLQVMRLSDCSNCWSLPSLGQLHALKKLSVERMKLVRTIGVEFYCGDGNGPSLIQPFQSLRELEFVEMPEWEEWLSSPSAADQCPDFPRLQELSLKKCPKLRGNLPNYLPSLKKLSISGCGLLHETTTVALNTKSLQRLEIDGSPGMLSILDMGMTHDTNRLRHLDHLVLQNYPSLLSLPGNGLPTSLTYLRIEDCGRLEFLSHEMMSKLDSLENLWLENSCHSMTSFPLGLFPKLGALDIWNCENLESLSMEGVDDNLSHLSSLTIVNCPNLVSFPQGGLPTPNLAFLSVDGCKNLKLFADRIHTLTALRYLTIGALPNLVSFAEGGLPPNLDTFTVGFCEKLKPSVEWGLQGLVSLRTFSIHGSEDVLETMLKEQLLPTTLHTLRICHQSSLKSLEGKGLQHLTSLQNLEIRRCKSLEFLPKEGLPESLSFLRIEGCPSLKKKYENRTGEEWSKIGRISCIKLDDEVII